MIRTVADIMSKDIFKIDVLDSVSKAQQFFLTNDTEWLVVCDSKAPVGTLTCKDLIRTHPNRIVADAMNTNVVYINQNKSIWEAEKLMRDSSVSVLLVNSGGELTGVVTEKVLTKELGKHTDLLTGLYKSDYLYYNAVNLINRGLEISVIFIDINRFGYIDKEFGHTVGDKILKNFAKLLYDNIPEDAYVCRFGGDEFVILTPYHLEKSVLLTKNLLSIINSHLFLDKINVSASAGISGGRRLKARTCDVYQTVNNLINLASLQSTKAKKEKVQLSIAEKLNSIETA